MKLKHLTKAASIRGRRGYTLTEFMIASTLSLGVLATLMTVMGLSAKEQRQELADSILQQEAGNLQDKVMRVVRGMRQSESVVFGNPVTISGAKVYQMAIMARGPAPNYPREVLLYNPTNCSLIHDPNRDVAGNEISLFASQNGAVLRKCYFFPSLKPGGIPDSTTMNVWLEMDDNGLGRRRDQSGAFTNTTVKRSFSVQMRNL